MRDPIGWLLVRTGLVPNQLFRRLARALIVIQALVVVAYGSHAALTGSDSTAFAAIYAAAMLAMMAWRYLEWTEQ